MIEVVTEQDLNRLATVNPNESRAKQQAVGILMDIVNRLPKPRAYVSEPTHSSDERTLSLWTQAFDMLTAILPEDEHYSVIEAETIRDLALFCPVLDNLSDATDPLWQLLASCRAVDAVYIPADSENTKRHMAMKRHATALGITAVYYHPVIERHRTVPTPPHP